MLELKWAKSMFLSFDNTFSDSDYQVIVASV